MTKGGTYLEQKEAKSRANRLSSSRGEGRDLGTHRIALCHGRVEGITGPSRKSEPVFALKAEKLPSVVRVEERKRQDFRFAFALFMSPVKLPGDSGRFLIPAVSGVTTTSRPSTEPL